MSEVAADTRAKRRWSPDVTLERMQEGETSALRKFEAAVGQGRLTEKHAFEWLRRSHPEAASEDPPVWMAKRKDRVVGRQVAIPLTLRVDGTPVRGFWAVDLMVDPGWRLKGVGPLLMETLAEERPVVLALGVSEAAHRMYRRAGWLDLGFVPRWVRPLRPARMAEQQFVGRRLGPLTPAADGFVGGLDRALAGLESLRGYRLERIPRFDSRVEDVVARVAPDYGVLGERDLAFLRWRFDEGPDAGRCVRYYLERRGEWVGYAVMHRRSAHHGPVLEILDCMVAPDHAGALLRLLAATPEARDALALHCMMLNRPLRTQLRLAGFVPRRPHLRLMAHLRDDAQHLEPLLTDRDRWLVTMADGDVRIGASGK